VHPLGCLRRFRLRARLGFSVEPSSRAREALPPRSDMDLPTRGPEGLEPSCHGCCQAHTMGPSDSHLGPLPYEAVEGQRPPLLRGPPVLRRALSLRTTPITPASHPEAMAVVPLPDTAAFPALTSGRLSRLLFRGLLGVHSRCGPQTCWPPFGGFCPGGSAAPVTQRPPTRSYEAVPPTASAGPSPARTRHLHGAR